MTDTTANPLREGSASLRLPEAPWEMRGEDRVRFLNGLVTCDVADLEPGRGRYGFLTSAKGRVLADVTVLAADDRFLLLFPAGAAPGAVEHILKYRIVDRVELEAAGGTAVITVAGPRAREALESLVTSLPAVPWGHAEVEIGGAPVRLAVRHPAPAPAWDLWLDSADAGSVDAALAGAGVAGSDLDAWDALRVARGVPRFGPDFGPDTLPQETGLEELTVSYDKGCYLGQEVVARIHYRGAVNRGLTGLDLGDAAPPPSDLHPRPTVLHDGRSAGTLGTAARDAESGHTLALAILHHRATGPGETVEVEGIGAATVRELPSFAGVSPDLGIGAP